MKKLWKATKKPLALVLALALTLTGMSLTDLGTMKVAADDGAAITLTASGLTINSDNLASYEGKTLTGTVTANNSGSGLVIDGVTVNLTIKDLSITRESSAAAREEVPLSAIELKNNATLNLTLEGSNSVTGVEGGAGIAVPGGCTLTITETSTGSLNAYGGKSTFYDAGKGTNYFGGAGIGGAGSCQVDDSLGDRTNFHLSTVGTINIFGGNITASAYQELDYGGCAAGIGGQYGTTSGSINISGGTIKAAGGAYAAGIGGGYDGFVPSICISGGNISATKGPAYDYSQGAAIGSGGIYSNGIVIEELGTVTISGGDVELDGNLGYGSISSTGVSVGNKGSVSVTGGYVSCGGSDQVLGQTVNAVLQTVSYGVYDRDWTSAKTLTIEGKQNGTTVFKRTVSGTPKTYGLSGSFQLILPQKLSGTLEITATDLSNSETYSASCQAEETINFAPNSAFYHVDLYVEEGMVTSDTVITGYSVVDLSGNDMSEKSVASLAFKIRQQNYAVWSIYLQNGTYRVHLNLANTADGFGNEYETIVTVNNANKNGEYIQNYYTGTKTVAGQVKANVASFGSVTLPALPSGSTSYYGTPTTESGEQLTNITISDGVLSFEGTSSVSIGEQYVITVPVLRNSTYTCAYFNGECNYAPYDITVTLTGCCNHSSTTHVEKTDATCASVGMEAYDLCADCGSKLVDGQIVTDAELTIAKTAHSWQYSASQNVLTASCTNQANCGETDKTLTVTVTAQNTYNGSAVVASYGSGEVAAWKTATGEDAPAITYQKYQADGRWADISEAPTAVGTYRAVATFTDNGTNYTAVKNFTIQESPITSVTFTDPVVQENTSAATALEGIPADANYTAALTWSPNAAEFQYNTVYTARVTLTAKANYVFDTENVTYPDGWTKSAESTEKKLILTKTYSATAKAKITSLTAPTVAAQRTTFTTEAGQIATLPKTVNITVEDGSANTMAITWALKAGTSYDRASEAYNTFVWTVTPSEYAGYDVNGQTLTGEVTIHNPAHSHEWVYSAKGNVIYVTCKYAGTENCSSDADFGYQLTLSATQNVAFGQKAAITIGSTTERSAWTGAGFTLPTEVKYYKGDRLLSEAPYISGTYTARVSLQGATASVNYTIEKLPEEEAEEVIRIPEDKEKDNFASGGLGSSASELMDALLTEEEQKAVADGQKASAWAELSDISGTVGDSEKKQVENVLPDGFDVGYYMDIVVWKQIGNQDTMKVTQVPNGNIRIAFTIPTELRKEGRNYKIVRLHEGTATLLAVDVNSDYELSFLTDCFSTYVLIYEDSSAENGSDNSGNQGSENPNTGDSDSFRIWTLVLLCGLFIVMIAVRAGADCKNRRRK